MTPVVPTGVVIPPVLASYHELQGEPLVPLLLNRAHVEPFNVVATAIFFLAILHTFAAARFTRIAHRVQARHADRARAAGRADTPSVAAEAAAFPRRGRGRLRSVGDRASHRDGRLRRVGDSGALLQRALSTTPNRCSSWSSWRLAATRPIVVIRGERAATCRAAGTRDAGCVVVLDSDDWSDAGVVHHGAWGDDDLARSSWPASSTTFGRALA